MVEFSPYNISLSEEPDIKEAEYFNKTILPKIVEIENETELSDYDRLGHLSLIGIAPMKIRYYTREVNGTNLIKTFIFSLVTNEEQFISNVNDKSDIIFNMIIWISGFAVLIVLLLISQ